MPKPKLVKTTAATTQALCNAIGISRDTYNNYKDHPSAPRPALDAEGKNVYNVKAWQDFVKAMGISTSDTRFTQQELKAELTKRDITLRDIAIEKERGKLIARDEHNREMMSLAVLLIQTLDSIPSRIGSVLRDAKAEHEARAICDKARVELQKQLQGGANVAKQLSPASSEMGNNGAETIRSDMPTATA